MKYLLWKNKKKEVNENSVRNSIFNSNKNFLENIFGKLGEIKKNK